jgi:phage gpG-like protein
VSTALTITMPDVDAVELHFAPITSYDTRTKLLQAIGLLVEGQTKRRLHEGKRSPDGLPWPAWSEAYKLLVEKRQEAAEEKAGRKSGGPHHTMLEDTGALYGSITSAVDAQAATVEVGSNLVYAATHNYGDPYRHIPQRQFLGLGEIGQIELDDLVTDFLGALL